MNKNERLVTMYGVPNVLVWRRSKHIYRAMDMLMKHEELSKKIRHWVYIKHEVDEHE